MRVLRGENDKHDEQRDEHTGGGVQPGATCLAGKSARRGSREEAEPGAAADASGADPSSAAGSADVEVMSSSRRFRLVSVDVWCALGISWLPLSGSAGRVRGRAMRARGFVLRRRGRR